MRWLNLRANSPIAFVAAVKESIEML